MDFLIKQNYRTGALLVYDSETGYSVEYSKDEYTGKIIGNLDLRSCDRILGKRGDYHFFLKTKDSVKYYISICNSDLTEIGRYQLDYWYEAMDVPRVSIENGCIIIHNDRKASKGGTVVLDSHFNIIFKDSNPSPVNLMFTIIDVNEAFVVERKLSKEAVISVYAANKVTMLGWVEEILEDSIRLATQYSDAKKYWSKYLLNKDLELCSKSNDLTFSPEIL